MARFKMGSNNMFYDVVDIDNGDNVIWERFPSAYIAREAIEFFKSIEDTQARRPLSISAYNLIIQEVK